MIALYISVDKEADLDKALNDLVMDTSIDNADGILDRAERIIRQKENRKQAQIMKGQRILEEWM